MASARIQRRGQPPSQQEEEYASPKNAGAGVAQTPLSQGLVYWSRFVEVVESQLCQVPLVQRAADACGVQPFYVLLSAVGTLLLLLGVFENLITNSVGFFYPAWQSFKAIESQSLEDDKQWLTYWVVYAAFSFVEVFSDFLLFWVPFYYLFKLVFLIWLFLPASKGALIVYSRLVRPLLLQYQHKIEGLINTIKENTTAPDSQKND